METVKPGSHVEVDYEGRLDDGSLFDTSIEAVAKKEGQYNEERKYHPLHVTLGQGMLIRGFENALIGMKVGEEKTVKIKCEEAYGEVRKELIKTFPKDAEKDKDLQVGMIVMVNIQEHEVPARVIEVNENVSLDFNHPLAGKDLTFKLKVVGMGEHHH